MTTTNTPPAAATPAPAAAATRRTARKAAAAAPTVEELAARVAQLSTEVGELRQASTERAQDAATPEAKYASLEDWLRDYLLPTFPRPVGELGMQRWLWCEQWWAHDEAVTRFMALWYGWEAARLEVTGMLGWLRELDYQLPIICGEDGPFRDCHVTRQDQPARHTDPTRGE